jgi:lysyl-tRNA synthetase class 2
MFRPSASIENLQRRAALLDRTRRFFRERGVLEVETPLLGSGVIVERHIDPPALTSAGSTRYLQASPEAAMKRLVAFGSGPIWQLARAFREDERGRVHNPEFSILEWYRPGFDQHALMDEVAELFAVLMGDALKSREPEKIAYRDVFRDHLDVDPLESSATDLADVARANAVEAPAGFDDEDRDAWLDLLLSLRIQPQLGKGPGELRPVFVYDYPASQASLARLSHSDERVAERFELFYDGVELCNGYHELLDATEQRARLEEANRQRRADGKDALALDERFLAALDAGLPDCSGVAMGFDRVVMLACGATSIDEVIAFPADRV